MRENTPRWNGHLDHWRALCVVIFSIIIALKILEMSAKRLQMELFAPKCRSPSGLKGKLVNIGTLVTAYEQSIEALRIEEADLRSRIERLTDRNVAESGGRLAAKLNLYKYRLAAIEAQQNEDCHWIDAVVTPIQSMIEKRVGPKYRSSFTRDSRDTASIRVFGFEASMTLGIERANDEATGFRIIRTLSTGQDGNHQELLPLDMPIMEIPLPLLAA